ncbi:MAG: nuclear transport factor 2 family protein [Carboxylicivirga sp.]|jgi:ketosteroid isomerase-like protein|nr:nuclear transport factor 2 family protein [Carboxylicivirga sp.]
MRKVLSVLAVALVALTACHTEYKKEVETLKKELSMKSQIAEQNKNNTLAFFKALEAENVESIVELFDDNAKHINPYNAGIFPAGAEGKDGIRAYWTPVFPNFDGMTFDIQEIYAMEDPNMVFVKYKGDIKLKNNAGVYSNDYYSTFKFNKEGKITEYVEIFNPITAAKGFGLIDKIK